MEGWLATVFLAGAIYLYCLPWIIAARKDHPHRGKIAFLNVFLGWTGWGWLIALVWAFSAAA